jgi:hypothetical protein
MKVKEAVRASTFMCEHCDMVHIELRDARDRIFATAVLNPAMIEHMWKMVQGRVDRENLQ